MKSIESNIIREKEHTSNSQQPKVTMLSQFGKPTRGVSPYSDMLSQALKKKLKISNLKTLAPPIQT